MPPNLLGMSLASDVILARTHLLLNLSSSGSSHSISDSLYILLLGELYAGFFLNSATFSIPLSKNSLYFILMFSCMTNPFMSRQRSSISFFVNVLMFSGTVDDCPSSASSHKNDCSIFFCFLLLFSCSA